MVVREPLERQFPAAVCSRRRIAGNEAEGKRKEDKEKTIRKDEDKEEKEKPSAGRCALYLFHTLIISVQCDGCVKKSGKIKGIFFTLGG